MTSHPTDCAAGTPRPAALPGEPSPVGLPGNPAPSPPYPGDGAGPETPAAGSRLEAGPAAGQKLAPGMAKLAAAMSEGELDRAVRRIARDLGVLMYHTFDSRRSEPGFPDLVLVGKWGVMYRELKKENGRLTVAQKTWLAALQEAGQDAGTWRPSALISGDVARELAALAGVGAR